MKTPVITLFEIRSSGLLSRELRLTWEVPGLSGPPSQQGYLVDIRPVVPGGVWKTFPVKGAPITVIPASAVKVPLGSARVEEYEARVRTRGGRPSTLARAAIGHPTVVAPPQSPALVPAQETLPPVLPPTASPETGLPVLPPGHPCARVTKFTVTPRGEDLVLAVEWESVTAQGQPSWAPEYAVAFRRRGGGSWNEFRTSESRYTTVARGRELTSMDVRVRAIVGGRRGAWSATETSEVVAPLPSPPARAETGMPREVPTQATAMRQVVTAQPKSRQAAVMTRAVGPPSDLSEILVPSPAPAPAATAAESAVGVVPDDSPALESQAQDRAAVDLRDLGEFLQGLRVRLQDLVEEVATYQERIAQLEWAVRCETGRQPPVVLAPPVLPPEPPPAPGDWIGELFATARFQAQQERFGRAQPDLGRVRTVLHTLHLTSDEGATSLASLAAVLGVDLMGARSFLTSVRRLLNIEGYEVLQLDGKSARLDWRLLVEQFEVAATSRAAPGNLRDRFDPSAAPAVPGR